MKNWSSRTQEEKDRIFNNYIVYLINGEIVGGFGLSDLGGGDKLLECLFSDKKGFGSIMINNYIKKQGNVFAYSHNIKFFTKAGFIKLNKRSKTGADLYFFSINMK